MYIKRDYSQPFFGSGRKRRNRYYTRLIFGFMVFIMAFLLFVYVQFDGLRLVALGAVGMAPTPTPFASELAAQGYERWLAGDLVGAETLFGQAVAQQPNNPDYLFEYGRAMHERILHDLGDDYTPVIEIADQLIAIAPNDPRGYGLKARALFYNDEAAEAIPIGINGLEVDPNYSLIHSALSMAYVDIARYQQALDHGERAVELDPMDAFAHRSYAYTLIFLGRRAEAIDHLEQAVALLPNHVNGYFELAIQYSVSDQDELAVATYEHILSLEPRNVRAHVRICAVYLKLGLFDQAQGYCEDALTLDPQYALAWQQLGELRFRRRNYEGAIEAFDFCRQYAPNSEGSFIQCWYVRGLAHFYLGNCAEAWTDLTDALNELTSRGEVEGPVVQATRDGLALVTGACPAFAGQAVPTSPPPTPLPPTPIGG